MRKHTLLQTTLLIGGALVLALGGLLVLRQYQQRQPSPEPAPYYGTLTEPTQGQHPATVGIALPLPQELYFAGEPVPLNDPDIRERLDRELHVNTYWHSNTILMMKRANRWLPAIRQVLQENGIPEDFQYMVFVEGGFMNAVSPSNAVGFWQLLSGTAKDYGLEVNKEVDERYHPLKSTAVACRYLNKAHERFGNWTNAAASYNIGMRGLDRRLTQQRVASYYDLLLNEETSRYMFRMLAFKLISEDPASYGFRIPEDLLYAPDSLQYVEITEDIDDLVAYAQGQGISYKTLKRHNPWLRKGTLTLKRKGPKAYTLALPAQPTGFNQGNVPADSSARQEEDALPSPATGD